MNIAETEGVFRVKAALPTGNGGIWYRLMGLKENNGEEINLEPTLETQSGGEDGTLEWDVPDNTFNRVFLRKYRPTFKIIEIEESLEEITEGKQVDSKPAEPVDVSTDEPTEEKDPIDLPPVDENISELELQFITGEVKLDPVEVKTLKSALREELNGAGVEYSKNSTAKELLVLAKLARNAFRK